jgi:hypothetical protein
MARTPARKAGILRAICRERRTVCWRDKDSNHRSLSYERVSRLLRNGDAGPISWMRSLSTGRLARRWWLGAGSFSTAVSLTARPMVRIGLPSGESCADRPTADEAAARRTCARQIPTVISIGSSRTPRSRSHKRPGAHHPGNDREGRRVHSSVEVEQFDAPDSPIANFD